jgi:hypothetical protein
MHQNFKSAPIFPVNLNLMELLQTLTLQCLHLPLLYPLPHGSDEAVHLFGAFLIHRLDEKEVVSGAFLGCFGLPFLKNADLSTFFCHTGWTRICV